jgi:hypothetical protein
MADEDRELDEIERTCAQEQSLTGKPKREAAERKRLLKVFSQAALRAMKARDARAFTALLRHANVRENSPEWERAWKYFYSGGR